MLNDILEFGVDSRDEYDRTPLILASLQGNPRLVKELIKNRAALNWQDRLGYSALHATTSSQSADILEELVKAGINIELRDSYGNTALWTAVMIPKNEFKLAEFYCVAVQTRTTSIRLAEVQE